MIVVDSVIALVPQVELDARVGDSYADLQSQLMTKGLRPTSISLSLTNSYHFSLSVVLTERRSWLNPV